LLVFEGTYVRLLLHRPRDATRRDRPPLDVLGDQTYESLARRGERMTTAAMATYA